MIDDLQLLVWCELFLMLPSWMILFAVKFGTGLALGGWVLAGALALRALWHRNERHWNRVGLFVIAMVLVLTAAGWARGSDVTIAWDPSPSDSITNYTVHVTSLDNNVTMATQVGTNTQHTLSLTAGTWNAWVTAVNSIGLRSDPSNVLLLPVPAPPVIRLNLEGAQKIDGPWGTLYAVELPLTNESVGFYRGRLEVVR